MVYEWPLFLHTTLLTTKGVISSSTDSTHSAGGYRKTKKCPLKYFEMLQIFTEEFFKKIIFKLLSYIHFQSIFSCISSFQKGRVDIFCIKRQIYQKKCNRNVKFLKISFLCRVLFSPTVQYDDQWCSCFRQHIWDRQKLHWQFFHIYIKPVSYINFVEIIHFDRFQNKNYFETDFSCHCTYLSELDKNWTASFRHILLFYFGRAVSDITAVWH